MATGRQGDGATGRRGDGAMGRQGEWATMAASGAVDWWGEELGAPSIWLRPKVDRAGFEPRPLMNHALRIYANRARRYQVSCR
jgi:hypothetical protein